MNKEEFISELRQAGYPNISDVYYAILEENGKLSVIPKAASEPPSAEALTFPVKESGISHILVSDGKINKHSLELLGLCEKDVNVFIKGRKLDDIFLLLYGDDGSVNIIMKERT